jgi:CRP-like cAMP-binding protein
MISSRAPLFTGLDAAALEDVLGCARSRRYTAGQLICREGDPSDSVFVLSHGIATAFVTSVTSSRVATVARLRPGDLIGEVGFITNSPRSASVMARSDAVLLEIAGEDFAGLLARHPGLLANITQLMAGRLARRNADFAQPQHRGDRRPRCRRAAGFCGSEDRCGKRLLRRHAWRARTASASST